MLQDITLGQYYPGKSVLHRLDPRVKIWLLSALIIGLFALDSESAYGVFTALTVFFIWLSEIAPRTILKSLKPLMWIIIMTFLIHALSGGGESILKVGIINVTSEGIIKGVLISLRLILLITLSSLLTFTTTPISITDALESILSPFRRLGLPVSELAMMMTIALRFVPTLLEETDRIIKAQRARGVDFETGNLITRAKSFVPILVPLFLSAFRRADELATAMEARCYRGGVGRTRMKQLALTPLDYKAVLFIICIIPLTILIERI